MWLLASHARISLNTSGVVVCVSLPTYWSKYTPTKEPKELPEDKRRNSVSFVVFYFRFLDFVCIRHLEREGNHFVRTHAEPMKKYKYDRLFPIRGESISMFTQENKQESSLR